MVGLTLLLDEIVAATSSVRSPNDAEFPAGEALLVVLAISHFALLALGIWALGNPASGLAPWEKLFLFLGFGLFFGQVSNANGHELIHRPEKALRRLGRGIFITHLFGHHATAHPHIHHRYVASDGDPNSAPAGVTFYRYLPKAWAGSFVQGLAWETNRITARAQPWWRHFYIADIAGSAICIWGAFLLGGGAGVVIYLGLAFFATSQLLLSDYVQHYGLRRIINGNGRLAPVGPEHSWNAPHWFTNHLMLAAPRHSDHHMHPSRTFANLTLDRSVPMLPRSLPVMGFVALFPRRWRRVMHPLLAKITPPADTEN